MLHRSMGCSIVNERELSWFHQLQTSTALATDGEKLDFSHFLVFGDLMTLVPLAPLIPFKK